MSAVERRPVRQNAPARASWAGSVASHQRPPSTSELDARRDERHRRRSQAARAAAEAGGMTSLVAALLGSARPLSLGSAA